MGSLIGIPWLDREEAERRRPYGKALDLGCGRGMHSVELARRGWDVTGIDMIPKALRGAEARAREAGVHVTFLKGDVTDLGENQAGAISSAHGYKAGS